PEQVDALLEVGVPGQIVDRISPVAELALLAVDPAETGARRDDPFQPLFGEHPRPSARRLLIPDPHHYKRWRAPPGPPLPPDAASGKIGGHGKRRRGAGAGGLARGAPARAEAGAGHAAPPLRRPERALRPQGGAQVRKPAGR